MDIYFYKALKNIARRGSNRLEKSINTNKINDIVNIQDFLFNIRELHTYLNKSHKEYAKYLTEGILSGKVRSYDSMINFVDNVQKAVGDRKLSIFKSIFKTCYVSDKVMLKDAIYKSYVKPYTKKIGGIEYRVAGHYRKDSKKKVTDDNIHFSVEEEPDTADKNKVKKFIFTVLLKDFSETHKDLDTTTDDLEDIYTYLQDEGYLYLDDEEVVNVLKTENASDMIVNFLDHMSDQRFINKEDKEEAIKGLSGTSKIQMPKKDREEHLNEMIAYYIKDLVSDFSTKSGQNLKDTAVDVEDILIQQLEENSRSMYFSKKEYDAIYKILDKNPDLKFEDAVVGYLKGEIKQLYEQLKEGKKKKVDYNDIDNVYETYKRERKSLSNKDLAKIVKLDRLFIMTDIFRNRNITEFAMPNNPYRQHIDVLKDGAGSEKEKLESFMETLKREKINVISETVIPPGPDLLAISDIKKYAPQWPKDLKAIFKEGFNDFFPPESYNDIQGLIENE